MIDFEPVCPGYVILTSCEEEWDQIREYIRENGFPNCELRYNVDAVRLQFNANGRLIDFGKEAIDWYIGNLKYDKYHFVRFSELASSADGLSYDCSMFDELLEV